MNEERKWQKIARRVLIGLGLWTAVSIVLALQLGFDYNFENFFPQDDPETAFFLSYRSQFESDNDYIVIALENEAGVFQPDFLHRVDELVAQLSAVANVDTVISPTRMVIRRWA
jgi:predicted RND superfamily exporter protein